jgi:hypothetical protein
MARLMRGQSGYGMGRHRRAPRGAFSSKRPEIRSGGGIVWYKRKRKRRRTRPEYHPASPLLSEWLAAWRRLQWERDYDPSAGRPSHSFSPLGSAWILSGGDHADTT